MLIIMHLLKWQYQPQRRGTSWRASISKVPTAGRSATITERDFLMHALQQRN